jgi:superfamily II DNA or RNA helicase
VKIIPREYQKLATEAGLSGLRSKAKRALVVLATGLGKTYTAAFITKELGAKRTLFLVHNNFILDHAKNEFEDIFPTGKRLAIYNGISKNGAGDADIVFATWQTMGGNLKCWAKDHFDLIIVDEAHHSEAETYKPVIKYFKGAKLGITATPDREDEADIRRIFGEEVINITFEEAIARGWLPRVEYHVITDESLDDDALQEIVSEIKDSKKRFSMAEVNRRLFIKKRDKEIARIIDGYNEKAIVFCSSVKHANRMASNLSSASPFHSCTGKNTIDTWVKNQATLDDLRNGIIRRVCAVNAFNEGVNVPSVVLVAFCRVTGVLTVFRQQLGRGCRPGKDKLIVLDFVGNLERIQLVLEMMNRISDLHEQFTPGREIEREGYVRKRFEVSGKGFEFTFSDKVVDLMEVLKHCECEFYPTWQEAGEVASKLGITTSMDYQDGGYLRDQRLPPSPSYTYSDFPGWKEFLNTCKYRTWREASVAAIRIGIKSSSDYYVGKSYKGDLRLPSNITEFYKDFPGWDIFLGKEGFYKTWQEARDAARNLGIDNVTTYWVEKRYKKDPKLPSNPDVYYKDFPGWKIFLGKE